MRWRLAEDGQDDQQPLFGIGELVGAPQSSGRLSDLTFLPVTARRILNEVAPSRAMPHRWTINAYRGCSHACTYCFARPTHEYLGLSPGADFDRRIVVKINAVERLRVELADPRWQREHVAMGTNTDPYQRAEGKFRLTRGLIEVLTEYRTPFSILTKSALVRRDLDLLTDANEFLDITVLFSIGTVDERVWRASEPGTPHPRRRLEAMQAMADAGIRTGALMAPILPGLSDSVAQLTETATAITAAGGQVRGVLPLYLKGATREVFLAWLAEHDPALHARYLARFRGRTGVSAEYRDWVRGVVSSAIQRRRPGAPAADPPVRHGMAAI
ncbi:MAG TPA: radical SAM protein [Jatrophihabitans sp.]|nr:radical SAM protein [Jatrophihabitans sp.]